MATITTAERVFLLGATELADPDPDAPPEEALSLYEGSYPALKFCSLSPPREEDGRLIYEVQRPAATTKGRDDEGRIGSLDDEIAQWESEIASQIERLADSSMVENARSMLMSRLRTRPDSPELIDPDELPMC